MSDKKRVTVRNIIGLFPHQPITKDTLDSLLGKSVYDSNGNVIGTILSYSGDKETIILDLVEVYLDDHFEH